MNDPRPIRRALPWLLLTAAATLVLLFKLQLSYDLGLFLPQGDSLEQKVVVEQMTSGPGSRLLLLGLSGADYGELAAASRELRAILAEDSAFTQVQNGETAEQPAGIPLTVSNYRFLLQEIDWSAAGLDNALNERMRDLAFGGGAELIDLIATDPYLSVVTTLEGLAPATMSEEPWFTADGTAVLLLETVASASDMAAQQEAIGKISEHFHSLDAQASLGLEITGPGAFGVELQRTIRSEAQFRSLMAVGCLLAVVLLAYRRSRLLLVAGIPLGFGVLSGLAVTALVFDQVHGITLAFGFTLLGIAIDFPLHLFSHSRALAPKTAVIRIWPTMRAGAVSTLLAYLALVLAGSPGLAQLGTFTAAGLLGAVAVTRFWLPDLIGQPVPQRPPDEGAAVRPRLLLVPAWAVLGTVTVLLVLLADKGLWHDAPESISPVPLERLQADNRLRQALSTIDLRYQLALSGTDLQDVLERTEALEETLRDFQSEGLLEDWRAVTQLIPSQATLERRQQTIPEPGELESRFGTAVASTPLDDSAFGPFAELAEQARTLGPLGPDSYRGSALGAWVDSHLLDTDDGWVSLVSLVQPDPERLQARLAKAAPAVFFVDLKSASTSLFATFRTGVLWAVAVAAVLISLLLALQRLRARRILWVLSTVTASLAATVLLVYQLDGQLTIIHLIGLLLVLGLGLDYALFFSRTETRADRRSTVHSVVACTVSTTLAFGILGGSSIPFLHFIGTTTALGSVLSFSLAFAGSYKRGSVEAPA